MQRSNFHNGLLQLKLSKDTYSTPGGANEQPTTSGSRPMGQVIGPILSIVIRIRGLRVLFFDLLEKHQVAEKGSVNVELLVPCSVKFHLRGFKF